MGFRGKALTAVNSALEPLNLRLQLIRPRAWDRFFLDWIDEAHRRGLDPNDIGDEQWATDQLAEALDSFYLPLVSPMSVVLELGPGSGRLTRHLVRTGKSVIAVDNSPVVCKWLREYFAEAERLSVFQIKGPKLPMVSAASIDAVVAHGFFEHLDQEELLLFLGEAHRVLKEGGTLAFNFDDLMGSDAARLLGDSAVAKSPQRFRFHHPESIRRIAEFTGFANVEFTPSSSRISFARVQK